MSDAEADRRSRLDTALAAARETRAVELGRGVLARVPDVFRAQFGADREAVIVADSNTFKAAGRRVQKILREAGVATQPPFIITDPDLYAEYSFMDDLDEWMATHNAIPLAVGSETDGSIVSPSAAAALVGIKPTIGLVSRSGIIPISHSQDTAGPMARTVTDAAILLGALTGVDPRDPATAESKTRSQGNYLQFLELNGLKGMRIGVPRKHFFGYSPATDKIAEAALDVLRQHGAVLVDPAEKRP